MSNVPAANRTLVRACAKTRVCVPCVRVNVCTQCRYSVADITALLLRSHIPHACIHGARRARRYLNLVLQYMPTTLYLEIRRLKKAGKVLDFMDTRSYALQLCAGLNYIHSIGICHRDMKPQNVLIDPVKRSLKVCDFGSAKILEPGQPNIAYICSRYYRAPELVFGAEEYTTAIDVWYVLLRPSKGSCFSRLRSPTLPTYLPTSAAVSSTPAVTGWCVLLCRVHCYVCLISCLFVPHLSLIHI